MRKPATRRGTQFCVAALNAVGSKQQPGNMHSTLLVKVYEARAKTTPNRTWGG